MSLSKIIRSSRVAAAVVVGPATRARRLDGPPAEPAGPSEAELLLGEAEQVLARARREAGEIRAASAAEGRSDGYQDALAAVHRELAETIGQLGAIAQQARLAQDEIIRNAERDVVELALAIAQKVIAGELTARPEIVRDVAASMLQEIELSTVVRIRLHPDDVRLIEQWWEDYLPVEQRGSIRLVPDVQVGRGGCVVDTRTGVVDSQISSRFDQLSNVLLQAAEPVQRSGEG